MCAVTEEPFWFYSTTMGSRPSESQKPLSPQHYREWLVLPPRSLQGRAPPLLTGGAVVYLGVRASPQELHRNPPKLADHCNGSQDIMRNGRSLCFLPQTTEHRPPLLRPLTRAVHLRQEGQVLFVLLRQVQQHLRLAANFNRSADPALPTSGYLVLERKSSGASASRALCSGLWSSYVQALLR